MRSSVFRPRWDRKPPLGVGLDPQHPLSSGLLLYYGFQEGGGSRITDLSGKNNTGTVQGTLTGIWTPGMMGGGWTGNGTDNEITTSTSFASFTGPMTWLGWFKTGSSSGAPLFTYQAEQTANSATSYDHNVYFGFGEACWAIFDTGIKSVTSAVSSADSQWHLVAALYDGTNMALYVDGKLIGSLGISTPTSYAGFLRVAGYANASHPNGGTSGFFSGVLDQVACYKRALSVAEIQLAYSQPYGVYTPLRTTRSLTAVASTATPSPHPLIVSQAVQRAATR